MFQNFSTTGGARIGRMNATYPFAKLDVNRNILTLDVKLIGHFEFQPRDIISIETYTLIPKLGQGIKINHRNPQYNSKIIVWTFKNPEFILNSIRKTGFLDDVNDIISEEDMALIKSQNAKDFPINPVVFFVISIVIMTIILNTITIFGPLENGKNLAYIFGTIISSVIVVSCGLTLVFPKIQKLILIKNRAFEDIKKAVIIITIIFSILLAICISMLTKF